MKTPSPPPLPTDPLLTTERQQAQSSLISNLQAESQMDMASLMARYGTRLAMSGASTSPLTGGIAPSGKA